MSLSECVEFKFSELDHILDSHLSGLKLQITTTKIILQGITITHKVYGIEKEVNDLLNEIFYKTKWGYVIDEGFYDFRVKYIFLDLKEYVNIDESTLLTFITCLMKYIAESVKQSHKNKYYIELYNKGKDERCI